MAVILEKDEIEHVNRMRNAVAYGQSKNSIIEWMNSERWFLTPRHPHIRYECVKNYGKLHGRIVKFSSETAHTAHFDPHGSGVPGVTIVGELECSF